MLFDQTNHINHYSPSVNHFFIVLFTLSSKKTANRSANPFIWRSMFCNKRHGGSWGLSIYGGTSGYCLKGMMFLNHQIWGSLYGHTQPHIQIFSRRFICINRDPQVPSLPMQKLGRKIRPLHASQPTKPWDGKSQNCVEIQTRNLQLVENHSTYDSKRSIKNASANFESIHLIACHNNLHWPI